MEIEEIEDRIERLIREMKPSARARFQFRFMDGTSTVKGCTELAHTEIWLKPPLITFFPNVIKKAGDYETDVKLRELIAHEFFHTLGIGHGDEMERRQKENHLWR